MLKIGHLPFHPQKRSIREALLPFDERPVPLFDSGSEAMLESPSSHTELASVLPVTRNLQSVTSTFIEKDIVPSASPHGSLWVPREFRITNAVLEQILTTVGSNDPETGGILGGSCADHVVRRFHFDRAAQRTSVTYSPDTKTLNELLQSDWEPSGVNLLGFIHSHPFGVEAPSPGDLIYARRILEVFQSLPYLLLPIVIPATPTRKARLFAYAVARDALAPEGVRVLRQQVVVEAVEMSYSDIDANSEAASRGIAGEATQTVSPHLSTSLLMTALALWLLIQLLSECDRERREGAREGFDTPQPSKADLCSVEQEVI